MSQNGSSTGAERMQRRVPDSWMFDPVALAYRTLLIAAGAGSTIDRAAIVRWSQASGLPAGVANRITVDSETQTSGLLSPRDLATPRMAGDRAIEAERADTPSVLSDGLLDTDGGAGEEREYCASPSAILMLPRHLPIRLDCIDDELFLTVLSYNSRLRRSGDRGSYPAKELRAALRAARRGFSALSVTLSVCCDNRCLPAPGAPLKDEQFLAGQLRYTLITQPDAPVLEAAAVPVEGIRLTSGEWVWVRLETTDGLVMTEPALFLGAETRDADIQLTLRSLDRMTFTCTTRGPGWTRRVVPMSEAEFWRSLPAGMTKEPKSKASRKGNRRKKTN